VGIDALLHVGIPELHGHVIRHELTTAGVFDEFLPQRRAGVERAKHIAAGEVMKARDGAEHLALRAFAAARSAKDEECAESFGLVERRT
jgi:hypothetical protein